MINNKLVLPIMFSFLVLNLVGCSEKNEYVDEDEYTVEYLVENDQVRKELLPKCEAEYAKNKSMSANCTNLVQANAEIRIRYHDVDNPNNTRMQTSPTRSD